MKGGQAAARHLHFTLEEGQQWAVVGYPEDAKRLFLELLAGRAPVTHGVIRHHYADDYLALPGDGTYRAHHDLVCFVPFHHHFRNKSNIPNFYYQQRFNSTEAEDAATVTEYLQGIISKNPNISWGVGEAMTLFGLAPLADKNLIKLSNGETRRLMLAAALVRNPRLLLLDHPLVGLDADTRRNFDGILRAITASGIHVVMTTTPHEVPSCITHVAVVRDEAVIEQGPRDSIRWESLAPSAGAPPLPETFEATLHDLIGPRSEVPAAEVVEMRKVTVRYGDNVILDGVDWRVVSGDAWALQGHNGAGKSTLLSLINGDNPQAYRNEIFLFGRRRGTGESIWDIKKKIGYVSPELHQYFPKTQTAWQVVLSGLFDTVGLFRNVSASQRETALRWLRLFGMDDAATLRLAQLSPDRQRLCLLARALIKNPELLILDEPCQGLGPNHRDLFKKLVDELHRIMDTTLIYVSHYAEDIPSCVTNYIRLERGKVIENSGNDA